tara:strand:- start:8373 stop:8498 length:126 start_codon:yes stop_codon:yes gene_type:complete
MAVSLKVFFTLKYVKAKKLRTFRIHSALAKAYRIFGRKAPI